MRLYDLARISPYVALYLTHNHLRPLLGRRLADELIVEDAADDLVERLKRAKGGLDHGEQPLVPVAIHSKRRHRRQHKGKKVTTGIMT